MKEYYQNKAEKSYLDKDGIERLESRLGRQLFDFERKGEEEVGIYEADGVKIEARCRDCDPDDFGISNYVAEVGRVVPEVSWKQLTDLMVEAEGERHALSDVLPAGWRIIFNANQKYEIQEASDLTNRIIYVNNISILKNLIVLAHEAGHAVVSERYTDEELGALAERLNLYQRALNGRKVRKIHVNRMLEEERKAVAVSWKILRPLIRAKIISKEDFQDCIHRMPEEGLGYLSEEINDLEKGGLIS